MDTGETLEESTRGFSTQEPIPDLLETDQIGRYRILATLGQGGFGVVYLAEQTEPVRRRVALKVIKPGMDSQAVITRFEAERQALAMMDHPSIAQVHDAGATEQGRPYFVMEHVVGEPITQHCDRLALGLRPRLELFIRVCDAVQHAHQKGIIHRDIKPSNILITEQDSIPKVIDFGIAKALHEKLTDHTVFTEEGQVIGTPEYMSPEQAEMTGDGVDTRTDIYQLGVLLYELLTGALPFDPTSLRKAGFAGLQKMLCDDEPLRPSSRLTTLGTLSETQARARGQDRRSLARSIRGDLDWIVMKCLEKEQDRRYDTANALIEDIRRHLNHEPILAGPPSARYRLRKFVRRHRVGVSVAATVLILLLAGIGGTTWGLVQAIAAREDARQRASELELITAFQSNMFRVVDPEAMGRTLIATFRAGVHKRLGDERVPEDEASETLARFDDIARRANPTDVARTLLDEHLLRRATETIDAKFSDQPVTDAALRQSVAGVYKDLGLHERALPLAERALELRRREFGNEHAATIESIQAMGALLWAMRRIDESEPFTHEALDLARRVLGPDDPRTLLAVNSMATLLAARRRFEEAEAHYDTALEGRQRVLGPDAEDTIASMTNIASMFERMERFDEAEALYRQALAAMRRTFGEDHMETIVLRNNLGTMLREIGRYDEAETHLRDTLARVQRMLGEDHPTTLLIMNNLGLLMEQAGNLDEALKYTRETVAMRRRTLGDSHPYTLFSIDNLAILLLKMEQYQESEEAFTEALEGCRRVLGDDNFDTYIVLDNMGDLYLKMERFQEAEDCYREALDGRRVMLGTGHSLTLRSMRNVLRLLMTMGRYADAEPLALEAIAAHRSYYPTGNRHLVNAARSLVTLYTEWHILEPDKGHDTSAATWQKTLDEVSVPAEE